MSLIMLGDCIESLKIIETEHIDLIVTSPPYKDEDGYDYKMIYQMIQECTRVLKEGCLFFINFGHLAGFKSRPFDVANTAFFHGLNWIDTIVWIKNHYTPLQGEKRLNNLWEYIFMFSKGHVHDLDRLSIGVPYTDKENAARYGKGKNLRCGGNVWNIGYETLNGSNIKYHNDRFPVELPTRCIKLANKNVDDGPIVLDPFSGSGSTAVAAVRQGWNYIGIEHNEVHHKTALTRLKNEYSLF